MADRTKARRVSGDRVQGRWQGSPPVAQRQGFRFPISGACPSACRDARRNRYRRGGGGARPGRAPVLHHTSEYGWPAPARLLRFRSHGAARPRLMTEPLDPRRAHLEAQVLPTLAEPVRYSPRLRASMRDLVQSVKAHRLEGLIAKRRNTQYEPGKRSGAWLKMRVNRGQEFVIGGYTVGGTTFDALIFGYYDGDDLIYAARTAEWLYIEVAS